LNVSFVLQNLMTVRCGLGMKKLFHIILLVNDVAAKKKYIYDVIPNNVATLQRHLPPPSSVHTHKNQRLKLYVTCRKSVIFILTATENFILQIIQICVLYEHILCIIYLKFLKCNYSVLHLLLYLCNVILIYTLTFYCSSNVLGTKNKRKRNNFLTAPLLVFRTAQKGKPKLKL